MLRNLLRVSKKHIRLKYPPHQSNPKRLLSLTQCYRSTTESPKTEEKIQDDNGETSSENKEKIAYNPKAVFQLCMEEFDDNFLYLPNVIDKDRWIRLVDTGSEVEENLSRINYKNFLSSGQFSDVAMNKLKSMKLFGLQIPEKYGGLGLNAVESTYIREIIGLYPSVARMLAENEEMGIKTLLKYGTEEQKQKYLPKLASGESMISYAILGVSSPVFDPQSYTGVEAFQDGDNFILNGQKHWVYNAKRADILLVQASHPVKDDEGILFLSSMFIVEKPCEGVRVNKPMEKQWLRGVDVSSVSFDEAIVKKENILGEIGKGFEIIYDSIKNQRTGTLSECSAMLKRLVHDTLVKCKQNKFGNQTLEHHQYTNFGLAQLSSLAYAVESLAYYIGSRSDYYDDPDLSLEIFMAKIFTAEAIPEALQLYFNIVGKHGYEAGSFVEEIVQNAPYYSIIDDTTHNLKLYVASIVLKYVANHLAQDVKMLRNPADNPGMALMQLFRNRNARFDLPVRKDSKLKLANCLHQILAPQADDLEYCLDRLSYCTKKHLVRFGKDSIHNDYDLMILGDVLIQTYALIACIARASRSAFSNLENTDLEMDLTESFSSRTVKKVKNLSSILGQNSEELLNYSEIGRKVFNNKNYFAEHPLMRNF